MANSFGSLFKITTFGESHGPAIGVVIDGCPAGLEIFQDEIEKELEKRKTEKFFFSSQRKEKDQVQILSGIFKNKTTGAPIAILISNQDFSSDYNKNKDLYRPGHANYTYLNKYGLFDFNGAGRASARETTVRVAAAAVAKKFLKTMRIEVLAFVQQIGSINLEFSPSFQKIESSLAMQTKHFSSFLKTFTKLQVKTNKSPLFCPDKQTENKFLEKLKQIHKEKETIGGIVRLISTPLPIGLGEPIFDKLSSALAKAMFSIPTVKGFSMGAGFKAASLKGSEMNDLLALEKDAFYFSTNRSGGTLGGLSNGSFLDLQIAFKPISTIGKKQQTYNLKKEPKELLFENFDKHDLCAAIRGSSVVEAMAALVLVDMVLLNKTARL